MAYKYVVVCWHRQQFLDWCDENDLEPHEALHWTKAWDTVGLDHVPLVRVGEWWRSPVPMTAQLSARILGEVTFADPVEPGTPA